MIIKSVHLKMLVPILAFVCILALFLPVSVFAEDSSGETTYNINVVDYFYRVGDSDTGSSYAEYNLSITLTNGKYPIAYRYISHPSNAPEKNYYNISFFILDEDSGLITTFPNVPMHYDVKSVTSEDIINSYDTTYRTEISNSYHTFPVVYGCPVYDYDGSTADIFKDKYDDSILDGTKPPASGQPWYIPSADVEGVFDKTIPIPIVQNADIQYSATANSEMYTLIFDWKHYLSSVVVSSNDDLLSDLKTEIWVRCPYNSDGTKTTFQKIKSGDLSSYYNSDTGKFGITLTDEEIAFAVAESSGSDYNYILDKVIRDRRTIKIYVRNVKQADSELLSSGYSWFSFISSNIGKDITINKNPNQTLDVDGANDSNSSVDHEGNDGRPSGGGTGLPGRGGWTTDELEDFIGGGFGLVGDNGLIALIGNVITFIPKPIINLLYFFLGACVTIAVIKLIF